MKLDSDPHALAFLMARRSVKPRELIEPGLDGQALTSLLTIASRVPDHGKLAPWRFVMIDDRPAFAALLAAAARPAFAAGNAKATADNAEQFAMQAPTLIALLSASSPRASIPQWEQRYSVGAAGMALLLGAHALGFSGAWITGWPAQSESVRAALAATTDCPDAQIAGFFFLGTAKAPPAERPRPALADITARWP